MAFAKLFYDPGVSALKKLKDIAGVCAGVITSVAQLESANQSKSEITVIKPAGWQLSASTPLEAEGLATRSQYVFSSPCVNPNKTKYAALRATVTPAVSSAAGLSTTVLTPPAAGNTSNVSLWVLSGAGISGSELVSPTFYPSTISNTATSVTQFSILTKLDLDGGEFYVSVTSRKIIIFSAGDYTSTRVPTLASVLEFPETGFTHYYNNVPVVNFSGSYIGLSNSNTLFNYDTNTISPASAPTTSPPVSLYRTLALCNWFSPVDDLRKNRAGDDGGLLNLGQQRIDQGINTSLPEFQLQPFVDIRTLKGEGVHYMSSLTGLYYTFLSPTYIMQGDEINYRGSTWVLLTTGLTTSSSATALAIRKE